MSLFLDRLELAMKSKCVDDKRLTSDLGIGKNSITYWRKKNNIPSGEILLKLSDYFDVSTDYLLGLTDVKEREVKKPNKDDTYLLLSNVLMDKGFLKPGEKLTKEKADSLIDLLGNIINTIGK